MNHDIPESVTNSVVEHCINEYVRFTRDRDMLRDHWFNGMSFTALAEKYDLSLPAVKNIVYSIGDDVLIRANELSHMGFIS